MIVPKTATVRKRSKTPLAQSFETDSDADLGGLSGAEPDRPHRSSCPGRCHSHGRARAGRLRPTVPDVLERYGGQFLVGASAFAAFGVLLGVLLPTARAAQGLGLALFFGLFFLAGGGPPPALLPDPINTFVAYTPMGWLIDAVSDPWHGAGWNPGDLARLAAMGALSILLATRRLTRT